MTVWRYTAVAVAGASNGGPRSGEIASESAAAARAALRRAGLQIIELSPVDARALERPGGYLAGWQAHLRNRRRLARAELYDGLATMLESGTPLVEALDTLLRARPEGRERLRSVLAHLREEIRSGRSLPRALQSHPSWFDAAEIAMIEAGVHSGELPEQAGAARVAEVPREPEVASEKRFQPELGHEEEREQPPPRRRVKVK